jgi:NitT/TauT family transport system permease protein
MATDARRARQIVDTAQVVALEAARRRRRRRHQLWRRAQVSGVLIGLLIVWEALTIVLRIPLFILPPPSAIAEAFLTHRALLLDHTWTTSIEVVLGYALSLAVGVPLGLLITQYRFLGNLVYPLLVSAQAVPKVAIAPVFVVWLGFGILPKVIIAFSIAFFPVVIGTVVGMRSVTPEMVSLARSMGASAVQTFIYFRLPAALPAMFGGFKLAVSLAVVGAIVGEFVGANHGLGYLVQVAGGQLNSSLMFAAIASMSALGVLFFYLIALIEMRVLRWHASERLQDLQASA